MDFEVRKPRLRGSLIIVVIVVVVGALTGAYLVFGGDGDTKQELTGSFTLLDIGGVEGTPTSCRGSGGYSDFGAGMSVTVRDGAGAIMATSRTRHGTRSELTEAMSTSDDGDDGEGDIFDGFFAASMCIVFFEVEIETSDFYAIEVGRRGEQTYSREELEASDWRIDLSLGA